MKKGISVVLLAYKEEENLRLLIPKIKEMLEKTGEESEIVVIDGPTAMDNSAAVCSELGARYYHQEKAGFAEAFRMGIREARYRTFLILDADFSHDPARIPALYERFVEKRADVVIGSRYVKGGVTKDSLPSRMMSFVLNSVYGVTLGIKAADLSTDYRIYRTVRLKKVEGRLKCRNYDVLQEVLLFLKQDKQREGRRFKVEEVPIVFEKRKYGESKRQLLKFIVSYMKSVIYLLGERIRFDAAQSGRSA